MRRRGSHFIWTIDSKLMAVRLSALNAGKLFTSNVDNNFVWRETPSSLVDIYLAFGKLPHYKSLHLRGCYSLRPETWNSKNCNVILMRNFVTLNYIVSLSLWIVAKWRNSHQNSGLGNIKEKWTETWPQHRMNKSLKVCFMWLIKLQCLYIYIYIYIYIVRNN
jgi:hypothetical protein